LIKRLNAKKSILNFIKKEPVFTKNTLFRVFFGIGRKFKFVKYDKVFFHGFFDKLIGDNKKLIFYPQFFFNNPSIEFFPNLIGQVSINIYPISSYPKFGIELALKNFIFQF
jgi:hypothetical protein